MGTTTQQPPRFVNPLCAFETACGHCGETAFVDTPIHGGHSTRRDCANFNCGRTLGFPLWNGETEEATADDADQRERGGACDSV
jgi:hypothetical protein